MYLIPANSKKGQLIFNIFRPVDLLIFVTGTFISIILMMVISSVSIIALIIKLTPIVLSALLVLPVPNYHNVMMFVKDVIDFYSNRRIYIWKGWCVMNEYTEN